MTKIISVKTFTRYVSTSNSLPTPGEPCSYKDFVPFRRSQGDLCFTFNSGAYNEVRKVRGSGKKRSLELTINIQHYDYYRDGTQAGRISLSDTQNGLYKYSGGPTSLWFIMIILGSIDIPLILELCDIGMTYLSNYHHSQILEQIMPPKPLRIMLKPSTAKSVAERQQAFRKKKAICFYSRSWVNNTSTATWFSVLRVLYLVHFYFFYLHQWPP